MANKNTKQARKQGLSNKPETMEGSGNNRRVVSRHAQDNSVFKGQTIVSSFGAPRNRRKSPRNTIGFGGDRIAERRYREQVNQFYGR